VKVLLVDWLGRGGIAQTSMAWRRALLAAGAEPYVVTRRGRELATDVMPTPTPPIPGAGRLLEHAAVVRGAVRAIAALRPAMVIIQNYVLPVLEQSVYRAARRANAAVVTVVHDHRLHSPLAGSGVGLDAALRASDMVYTHTAYVADRIDPAGRTIRLIPHPLQLDLLEESGNPLWPATSDPTAIHFGVLKRSYKGTDLIVALSQDPATRPWRFAVLGAGAPPQGPRLLSCAGYVPAPDLVASIRAADAAILPYSFATQSGAVVLAQALGKTCVASAVGGIPEQIEDGVTGRLVPAGAGTAGWAEVLLSLRRDPAARTRMGEAGRRATHEAHQRFTAEVAALVAG